MRIAQVAPLYESVPPSFYGGTERVVSYLTDQLVRSGHEVTLYATGDSRTCARLVPVSKRALRLDADCIDPFPHHILAVERVIQDAAQYDIIHFHVDYLHYPLSRRQWTPHVTTLHGRLDIADLVPLYREFSDVPLVSISDAQRQPLSWANWQATVYHGIPADLHTFRPEPGRYLTFVGRISPEKRIDRAIAIAQRASMPLKIAAKVDRADREYFDCEIRPLLDHPLVEFLGEVGGRDKDELVGGAYALLFPIDWPEPFGLVLIEAMACGTPVIACCRGAIPEVVDDGVSGFVVDGVDSGVRAVERIPTLCRHRVRQVFERRFTAERMAKDYLDVYQRVITRQPVPATRAMA